MFLVEAPGRERIKSFFEYILAHELPTQKMSLCIDNITITDIVGKYGGYLDKPFRIGLDAGVPAIDMIRMATLNTATHYKKDGQLGSLTPGRFADIVLLRELNEFPPELVIANGKVAARRGKMIGAVWLSEVSGKGSIQRIGKRLFEYISECTTGRVATISEMRIRVAVDGGAISYVTPSMSMLSMLFSRIRSR